MSDKSTPIENLNNNNDDSETVNQILSKYNNIQDNPEGSLPPIDDTITENEEKFENRNLNKEMFDLNSDNTQFQNHMQNEKQRVSNYNNPQFEDEDEESYEEYELEELPLWKKILNEIRIPILILVSIFLVMNKKFDSLFLNKITKFVDQYGDVTHLGFLIKSLLTSVIAYLLIRFIRF